MIDGILTKIERTISKAQIASLQDLIVYQESDGTYILFEKYSIVKRNNDFIVSSNTLIKELNFSALKNAVTWCIYDKRNLIVDAKTIIDLDDKISRLDSDITIRQQLMKKAKTSDDKLIVIAKLGEDRVKRKQLATQLDNYIKESKTWQLNRFSIKPKQ
jgi:hypothetical protein